MKIQHIFLIALVALAGCHVASESVHDYQIYATLNHPESTCALAFTLEETSPSYESATLTSFNIENLNKLDVPYGQHFITGWGDSVQVFYADTVFDIYCGDNLLYLTEISKKSDTRYHLKGIYITWFANYGRPFVVPLNTTLETQKKQMLIKGKYRPQN